MGNEGYGTLRDLRVIFRSAVIEEDRCGREFIEKVGWKSYCEVCLEKYKCIYRRGMTGELPRSTCP